MGAVVRPAVIAALLTAGLVAGCTAAPGDDGPLEVAPVSPAASDQAACRSLLAALPPKVADQPRRDVATAWAGAWGEPPIVLRCGVRRPAGFAATSTCLTVNGVDWFVPEEQLEDDSGDLVMTTVKRAQHVEVRMPREYWPPATALADLSAAVSSTTRATGSCW